MYFKLIKDKDMLCGPACLHYVLNFLLNKNIYIPKDITWITSLATFLKLNTKFKHQLSCYDSKLYSDYLLLSETPDYDGFKSIKEYLFLGGNIKEKKLSIKLINSILYDNYIIACVSSSIFNKDKNLLGGHYITLLQSAGKNFIIANPKNSYIEIESVDKEHILNSITSFGSWILTIKKW